MTDLRKAAEMALKLLENNRLRTDEHLIPIVVDDLRQALAQPEQDISYTDIQMAELIMSDCGHSSDYTPLLDRIAGRLATYRQALAKPEQEPVAWMYDFLNTDNRDEVIRNWITQDMNDIEREKGFNVRPLYAALVSKPWVDLSDMEKDAARYRWLRNPTTDVSLVLDKRTKWIAPDDGVPEVGGHWEYEYRAGDELDEAIDKAIEAKLKKNNNG